MKQFIAFVRKEFFHIFRDRRTMLILLGMPVVQIILFGFAITTEVKNVRVAILDPSNDVVTRRIIDRLDASEYFSVTTNLNTPDEVESLSDGETLTRQSSSASNLRITFIPEMLVYSWWPMLPTPIRQPHRLVMPPTSYPLPEAKCFRREYRFPLLFPK